MPTVGVFRHVVLVVASGTQPHVRPPQPAPHQGEAVPVGLHGGGGQAPPRALQRPQRLLQVCRRRQLLRVRVQGSGKTITVPAPGGKDATLYSRLGRELAGQACHIYRAHRTIMKSTIVTLVATDRLEGLGFMNASVLSSHNISATGSKFRQPAEHVGTPALPAAATANRCRLQLAGTNTRTWH